MLPAGNHTDPCATRRLWSLWDMTVNFSFPQIDYILTELDIQFSVSRKNLEHVAAYGDETLSGPKAIEAMKQSVEGAGKCVELSERAFQELKCPHIDYYVRQSE